MSFFVVEPREPGVRAESLSQSLYLAPSCLGLDGSTDKDHDQSKLPRTHYLKRVLSDW